MNVPCTNNAAKSQPPPAGPPPDAGNVEGGLPGVDGMPADDGDVPDSPLAEGGVDTGAPDTGGSKDSGGG